VPDQAEKRSTRVTWWPTLAMNGTDGMLTPQSAYATVLVALPLSEPSASGFTVTTKVAGRDTPSIVRSPDAANEKG